MNFTHSGDGWEVVITKGATFRAYDVVGLLTEVAVEDGVISHTRIPDEMNAEQARAVAAMLMEAAHHLDGNAFRAVMQQGAKLNGEVKAGEEE